MKISALFFLSFLVAFSLKAQEPKNILIIVADDLGWNDVGFHGSEIQTPALDKLAQQSVEFTRFYVASVCTPTRAGLLTGKYPDRFNLRNGVISPRRIGGLPPETKTIAELLQQAGYHTALFGKWHLGHSDAKYHPNNQGFDYFYGHYNGAIDYFTHTRYSELDWHRNNEPSFDEGYSTDLIGKETVTFLERSKNNFMPFFAVVSFNAPHSPMQAKEEDLHMYGYDPDMPDEGFPIKGGRRYEPGDEEWGIQGRGNTLRQTYSAMVTGMDKAIGDILDTLEKYDLEDNTLVWFLSDNGGTPYLGGDNTPLRGGKFTQWEGGVRVVSLLRWPGKTEPNSKNNQLVSYIDVAPTLMHIAGDSMEDDFDGVNILDAITGGELSDRFLYLGGSGIVTQTWKMNEGELFKIEEDLGEEYNIAEEYEDIVHLLNMKLTEFRSMQSDKGVEMQTEDWLPPRHWTMPN